MSLHSIRRSGSPNTRIIPGPFAGDSRKDQVFALTQTPDDYLWLGTGFGLLRFDGVRAVPWVPPAGARLPSPLVLSLLTGHDGTLWIGTLRGLVGSKSGRATECEQLAGLDVYALTEGRDGTVWAAR